jgi:hypothetical protein
LEEEEQEAVEEVDGRRSGRRRKRRSRHLCAGAGSADAKATREKGFAAILNVSRS